MSYYDDNYNDQFVEYTNGLELMANLGNPEAQLKLGHCYFYGRGVRENKRVAVEWYRKAAEQGLAEAQYRLGDCYSRGLGVSLELVSAFLGV